MKLARTLLLLPLWSVGCGQDFDPYNEILGFRLLGIRADEPALLPGSATRLRALVSADGPTEVEYDWSWCPFRAGADRGFECAVDRAQLQTAIDAELGPGLVEVPSFQLGTSSTAMYAFDFNPGLIEGLCTLLRSQALPGFVELPPCEGSFGVSVRLEVKSGTESIVGLKEIDLVYDPLTAIDAANENPTILGATVFHPSLPGGEAPLADEPLLDRNTEVRLRLDIPETVAEPYAKDQRERLVVTWFVEGGETDSSRTSYSAADENSSLAQLRENLWTTPRAADFPASELRLYFVIRDGRGGIGWLEGQVRLGQAP